MRATKKKITQGLIMGGDENSNSQQTAVVPSIFPTAQVVSPLISQIGTEFQDRVSQCKTNLEALEMSVEYLTICSAIAADTYKSLPIPDNAYQLAALTNSHKSTLSQLEKMKDPEEILADIEQKIKGMFVIMVRALAIEIDKVKRQLVSMHADEQSTIDDLFSRMTNAIQPETQRIYDDLEKSLKKVLGIKK